MRHWKITLLLSFALLPVWTGAQKPLATGAKLQASPPAATRETRREKSHIASALPRIEFLRDVAPILDKNGCSVAECHGKFGGRGGLQISLLTLSPEDDYEPLVYGERGRRINFAAPENSLILRKATGQVSHKGGMRFPVNSPAYKTLLQWIQEGAPFTEKDPRLVTLTLKPEKVTLQKTGQKQAIRALATYTNGSTRDVTAQTVFSSTNDAVLRVSPSGVVTGTRWGGGAILGRYLGSVSASFFTLPQARNGKYPTYPTANVIDKLVFDNLKRMNILPSALSNDAEFFRRVTLDTLGRLPTPEEINAFLKDKSPDKRAKTIDNLLEQPEFADLRTLRLADLLRVHPRRLGQGNGALADRATALFYEWIWKNVRDNRPWDAFVKELLLSRGSTFQNGPANFYRIERAPNDRMENLGQAFLGVRMSCARCHKHPFDRWNTDDYWNFSAFFAKVRLSGGTLLAENIVSDAPNARLNNQSVTGKNRGKVAPPTYLGEKQPAKEDPEMVAALADWITDAKNPFFARATVNRLWSNYFGRGIIHPVDDMRPTTPESVPGLLNALASELVSHKYDIKHVIRLILNSRTYQLSAVPNTSNRQDDVFFSRFPARPMPAQVLLDMVNQAAGVSEQFGTLPERTRAVQAVLPVNNAFLDAFGQSHREFLADIDPKLEPNLVQTLHMINSPYINNKIQQGKTVAEVVKATQTDTELIEALYLRTFCRPPTTAESSKAATLLKTDADRKEGASDLLWALLTSREFYFNH